MKIGCCLILTLLFGAASVLAQRSSRIDFSEGETSVVSGRSGHAGDKPDARGPAGGRNIRELTPIEQQRQRVLELQSLVATYAQVPDLRQEYLNRLEYETFVLRELEAAERKAEAARLEAEKHAAKESARTYTAEHHHEHN